MGIGIWQLLIILLIILLLFGAKRLRNVGGDLGAAIKGFRGAVKEGESDTAVDSAKLNKSEGEDVIEGEVSNKEKNKA